jgi:hypothetical protein
VYHDRFGNLVSEDGEENIIVEMKIDLEELSNSASLSV